MLRGKPIQRKYNFVEFSSHLTADKKRDKNNLSLIVSLSMTEKVFKEYFIHYYPNTSNNFFALLFIQGSTHFPTAMKFYGTKI